MTRSSSPPSSEPVPEGISLTARAMQQTHKLRVEYPHSNALRVYLAGKGCDGFTYGVQFVEEKNAGDLSFPHPALDPVELICDKDSYVFLQGSVIDYVDDERGKGYLVENPHHRKFRGKFYKRKVWQEKLEQHKNADSS